MKAEDIFLCVVLFVAVFVLTAVYGGILIPILRRFRADQPILEIGPVWHLKKKGTPTMGGLSFILALLSVMLGWSVTLLWQGDTARLLPVVLVVLFAMCCGAIGFFDDYKKLLKKENQGLLAWQKYFLQLVASALFLIAARVMGFVDTSIRLPFFEGRIELGFFYYPLALLFLTGLVNALNLTDGLDGLLGSTTAVLGAFFLLYGNVTGDYTLRVLGVLLLGMMLGFLLFNHHPAKVFMGDTGSLFLGALVAGAGLISSRPVSVLGASGIFVIEAASVILQVAYFKLTHGKRLFLMAPLHHHFEKRGLRENTIVGIFSAAGILFAAVMLLGG